MLPPLDTVRRHDTTSIYQRKLFVRLCFPLFSGVALLSGESCGSCLCIDNHQAWLQRQVMND